MSKSLPLTVGTLLVAFGLSAAPAAAFDHAPLQGIVKAAVKGRYVKYDQVQKRRKDLQAYVAAVASADVSKMGRTEKMAFYTNAYNAIVLEQVLVHGRPKSVLDVKGFFDKKKHKVAGESLTLNDLEGKKLRSKGDPRIHFVVNCASDDCPPLAPFVYDGKKYKAQLEKQTRAYLRRAGEVKVDEAKKTIQVVQLFEWYQKDWGSEQKAREFLAKYVPEKKEQLLDPSYKLTFRPYDWDLNKAR